MKTTKTMALKILKLKKKLKPFNSKMTIKEYDEQVHLHIDYKNICLDYAPSLARKVLKND